MNKPLPLCVDSRDSINRVLVEITSIAYLSGLASEHDETPLRGLALMMERWADALSAVADHETRRAEEAAGQSMTNPVVRPVSHATPPAVTSPWLDVPRNREVLRSAAAITASIETARSMIAETDSADCSNWVTNHAIDTVLNCAQLAADTLYTLVAHHIGEDDATPGADNARG